jgi:hypothetical protein
MAEAKQSLSPEIVALVEALKVSSSQQAEAIKEAVVTAVAEATKPSDLELEELAERRELREKEKQKVEAEQQNRAETAKIQREQMENRRNFQRTCLHESARQNYTAYVHDPAGGYIICQRCQAIIRPESQKPYFRNAKTEAIFDDVLFAAQMQKGNSSGIFA